MSLFFLFYGFSAHTVDGYILPRFDKVPRIDAVQTCFGCPNPITALSYQQQRIENDSTPKHDVGGRRSNHLQLFTEPIATSAPPQMAIIVGVVGGTFCFLVILLVLRRVLHRFRLRRHQTLSLSPILSTPNPLEIESIALPPKVYDADAYSQDSFSITHERFQNEARFPKIPPVSSSGYISGSDASQSSPTISTCYMAPITYARSSPPALSPPPIYSRARRPRDTRCSSPSSDGCSNGHAVPSPTVIASLGLAAVATIYPTSNLGRQVRQIHHVVPEESDFSRPSSPTPTVPRKRVPSPSDTPMPSIYSMAAQSTSHLPDEFNSKPIREQLEEMQRELALRNRSRLDALDNEQSYDPHPRSRLVSLSSGSSLKRPMTSPSVKSFSDLPSTIMLGQPSMKRPLAGLSDADIDRIIGSLAERMKSDMVAGV